MVHNLEWRQQRGLPLAKNPLGIKRSMELVDEWLVKEYGAVPSSESPTRSLFWSDDNKMLLTWKEAIERGGGIGPKRMDGLESLKDWPRSAPYQWFVTGDQKDFSFYNDPSYVYLTLFCIAIVSGRTVATEGWDIAKRGLIRNPLFLAGGTIWEACSLIRRGAERVYLSNYQTPQIDFYKWVARKIGMHSAISFLDEASVPRDTDIVIANEYLEHFQKPVEELDRLMANRPLFVYHRSSFCLMGHGHPIPIKVGGLDISNAGLAMKAFDSYCASIPGYRLERVSGGWRDSLRRLSKIS